MKRVALLICLLLGACSIGAPQYFAGQDEGQGAMRSMAGFGPAPQWQAVRLSANAVPFAVDQPDFTRVGALVFRGGLHLESSDPRFGGLSGLHVDNDGRLLAVTDKGDWFAARLVLNGQGDLTGLADARLAPIHGENGKPLGPKRMADAEGLTKLPDGRFAVSFEQVHKVRIYDLEGKGPSAPPVGEVRLGGVDKLGANTSLEALAAFGDRLLIGAERAPQGEGGAFWVAGLADGEPSAMAGRAVTADGFSLVSLDRTAGGDFIALERFYAPLIGARIVVRRVEAAGLQAPVPVYGGPILAQLGPPMDIDNFEGVAAVQQGGKTRLYLISDNNFRKEQRTLLYAFDVDETPAQQR
jgi:hypothetical protein